MTTTPHAELLTKAEIDACWDWLAPGGIGRSRYDITREIERALLARLGEQKPVAQWQWRWREGGRQMREWKNAHQDCSNLLDCPVFEYRALYAHPPAAQPVAQGEREAFVEQFEEWQKATGALPYRGSWFYELYAMFEEADKALAVRSTAKGAELKTMPEQLDMGEGWSVTVFRHGVAELTISDEHYSGGRDLDEALIVGAAQHLLSFMGYGLPPTEFDPDDEPPASQVGQEAGAGWQDIATAPRNGTQILMMDNDGTRVVGQWGKHNHVPLYGWIRPVELYGEEVDGFDAVAWSPIPPAAVSAEQMGGE